MSNRWFRLLAVILLLYAAYAALGSRAISHGPGIIAPEPPVQAPDSVEPFQVDDYQLQARARFSIEARVLGRSDYYFGREADVSPIDLALGWGPMSDEANLAQIAISQSNRFYYWRVAEFPIPRRVIETHSANMHMIPASDRVADQLETIREGDVVALSGYLVDVLHPDGWSWRTSLTRKDTGAGACEIIYVENVNIRPL